MIADIVTLLIPVYILIGLVLLLIALSVLARVQGGRYVRPRPSRWSSGSMRTTFTSAPMSAPAR